MKFGNNIDLQQNQTLSRVAQNLASAPSSPKEGQEYWNSASHVGFFWNGTSWRPMDAAALTDGSIPISGLATNPLARANHTGTQLAATISNLQATVVTYTLDTFAAPTANVSFNSFRITNLASAVSGTDAVNFSQMTTAIANAVAGQTAVKNPVRLYAAGNITLSGAQTIDGVAVATGDRIAAFNQTTGSNRLIWVANTAGAWSLATDNNATGQIIEGTDVLVNEGTAYAGTIWRVTTSGTITIGTTAVTWTQIAQATSYAADGSTITLTGLTFSVKIDGSGWLTSSGSGIAVDKTKVPGKFAVTITGDGSTTTFAVTHSLNNSNPAFSIRDSSGNQVLTDNQVTSANALTITFGIAPGAGVTYSVAVYG